MAEDLVNVNGQFVDFSHLEMKWPDGSTTIKFKSATYKETMTPTKVYGAHAQPIGKTRGTYECEFSIEVYTEHADEIRDKIAGDGGNGYGEIPIDVTLSHAKEGQRTVTVETVGATASGWDASFSQGSDALTVKIDFSPLKLKINGRQMVQSPLV